MLRLRECEQSEAGQVETVCDGRSLGEVMQGEERVTRDWTGTGGQGQGEGQGGVKVRFKGRTGKESGWLVGWLVGCRQGIGQLGPWAGNQNIPVHRGKVRLGRIKLE